MHKNTIFNFLKSYSNGTYYLTILIRGIGINWFTDCGDWFIYLRGPHYTTRFSSAGYLRHPNV